MFKAQDIMNADIVTISPDDTVDHAISLMLQYRITGLIVVDSDRHPVGVVSDYDLLDMVFDYHIEENKVSRYMTRDVETVDEATGWTEMVDIIRERRIRRLPVTRDGRLIGIVTRHDLMRAVHGIRKVTRERLHNSATAS
ncbi:MAG: CBS domain-containing protein [Pirellulales bacterium]|nr:CBS domain-containing protein [Pirellulales bacterium]